MNERPYGLEDGGLTDDGLTDDGLAEEAALWVARMQSADATEAEREAFHVWLRADAAHASAYEDMQSLWGELGDIELAPAEQPKRRGPRRAALAGVAGLCMIGLAALFAENSGLKDRWQADYYTEIGETRVLALEDGSRISLNTDTAIAVHYSQDERRITLLRGEAYFDVTKNPERPFIVTDGSLTAKALGTHYSVRAGSGALPQEVQVEEGRVEVTTDTDVAVLTPGETVTLDDNGRLVRARKDVANSMAWREGKLVFSGQPLREVLDTLSQYRRGRIVILDEAAARQHVSGIFDLKDTDQALTILEESLPVSVSRLSNMLVFVRSR
ncbi:Protein FecR [Rhizobium rhizogenes]|uniref:Protein FecR n=1 Tax=Rhizobium rhizogenes TaxID=359 RepID=A0AAN2A9F4_RHIRH|nr:MULTISPECIES: FecR family protein [Rhizobium/Agrobacterium group]AQS63631.1 FecR family protein [Rhizobium rhizogenes]MCZ7441081.1 FecR family protein [Rhizobium rhizogenes]NSZ82132.1 FecR family protein [Agrobacterium tumefaciens]OAM62851.1 iron dicitrate transport regulator FecR [Rhizobium rhizogenes]CAD0216419.1 Protein FecR [Rhizobium rhizogenes]